MNVVLGTAGKKLSATAVTAGYMSPEARVTCDGRLIVNTQTSCRLLHSGPCSDYLFISGPSLKPIRRLVLVLTHECSMT
jgi:hypothetical protein